MRVQRLRGPGNRYRAAAYGVGHQGRVLLQDAAQFLEAVLAAVPDAGEPGAGRAAGTGRAPVGGPVLQPDRAPLGEPGHEELTGERGEQVLVELPGQQVGRLGEEGERAPVQPVLLGTVGGPGGTGAGGCEESRGAGRGRGSRCPRRNLGGRGIHGAGARHIRDDGHIGNIRDRRNLRNLRRTLVPHGLLPASRAHTHLVPRR